MAHQWMPGEPEGDELERLFALGRDAWRGDVHGADEAWRGPTDEDGVLGVRDESWRGDEHVAEWPEGSAGPEYWMYKRAAEGR